VSLLSAIDRPRTLIAGLGFSGAILGGTIALILVLGGLLTFHGLRFALGRSEGPSLKLASGLPAARTLRLLPAPAVARIVLPAGTGATAALAGARGPRPAAPRLSAGPVAARPAPRTPIQGAGASPASLSSPATQPAPVQPVTPPSAGAIADTVASTTSTAGATLAPVSPSAADAVTSAGQTAAQAIAGVVNTVQATTQVAATALLGR
jgi:LPS-assembly protein